MPEIIRVDSDLWCSWSWLQGKTWDHWDRRETRRTEPPCWQLDIYDDLNIFPPERQWRQCRSRWSRSQYARTCWDAYDRSWHCRQQWSHRCRIECPTAAPDSIPLLVQSKHNIQSIFFRKYIHIRRITIFLLGNFFFLSRSFRPDI